ncbi:GSCOCG00009800001-RA-CDS, partial [Cotesia congregata]
SIKFIKQITNLWAWSPFDWGNQVETIRKTSMSQKKSGNFEQNIKTVLSWVVVSRVAIAHIYIFTHVLNLCSILMWSQRRMLLPWMVISAFKNFILEVIVFIVVVLLYIEGNISDYLLGGIVIEKLISVGLAAQNWFTINAFYMRLKELDQKKLSRMSQRKASTFNLMIGMSMRHSLTLDEPDQYTKKRQRFISVPNFESLPVNSPTEFGEETNSIRISRSLNTISMLSIRYFDHKDNIFNADGFRLPISERVIMILGVPFDYVEKVRLSSSIGQTSTYPPITKIQEENSSLSCTCPS